MGHPPIEKLLPKTGWSIYKLARLAAQRAAELASGKKPLVDVDLKEKTATIALEEIAAGQVVLDKVSDQFRPQEQPQEQSEAPDLELEEEI